tara:strand:- start:1172 stop:1384 length:213 start_codon:yes stop_codon:yes gene_type:complete
MSMLELIEAIEKEKKTTVKLVENVEKIPTEGRSYEDRLEDLSTIRYGTGMIAGFNVVLQLIIDLYKEVEA